jgi:hypothetical protein
MSRSGAVRDVAVGFVVVASGVAAEVGDEVPSVVLPLIAGFFLAVFASLSLFPEREVVPVGVGDVWQDQVWRDHLRLIVLRGVSRDEANAALGCLALPPVSAEMWSEAASDNPVSARGPS